MKRLKHYLEYYGLPVYHSYEREFFYVREIPIFVQHFVPHDAKDHVVLLHGYMDHSGALAPFITALTESGYGVTAVDLPGHGLSGGKHEDVKHFQDYEETLRRTLALLVNKGKHQPIVIGHSTGGGVAAHYALKRKNHGIRQLLLVAPLARSRGWRMAKVSHFAMKSFLADFPRKYRPNSGDESYLERQKKDPLQISRISLSWVNAMFDWESTFSQLHPLHMPVDIFQGTKDRTVAWEHNLQFFYEKFPQSSIYLVENGQHQLLNEAEPIKGMVYQLVKKALVK